MNVSQSEIRTWLNCRRKHRFIYREGLRRKERALNLAYGTAFHAAMASYYQGQDREDVLAEADMIDPKILADNRAEEGEIEYPADWIAKQAHVPGMLRAQLRAYMDLRPNGIAGEFVAINHIEDRFSVEYAPGIEINGRIDGLAQDVHGSWWLLEHKTAVSIGASTILNLRTDLQIGFYLLICQLMRERGGSRITYDDRSLTARPYGQGDFPEVAGVIYNVARKPGMRPKKIRVGNWEGRCQFTGETQATVMLKIQAHAESEGDMPPSKKAVTWSERSETVDEFEERIYQTIIAEPSAYFLREYEERNDDERLSFEVDLRRILQAMQREPEYPNPQHCPDCWFRPICAAPSDAQEAVIESMFVKSEPMPV